jgi:hypothetical protein
MPTDPTPFEVALSATGRGLGPAIVMSTAEGVSVLQSHDVSHPDPRAIKIPVHIQGGDRSGLEAMGFIWLEEPPANPRPADYVTVKPPEHWTVEVHTMYLTLICDERGIARVSLYNNHQWWDSFAKTEVMDVGRVAAGILSQDESATLASVRWHSFTPEEQASALDSLRQRGTDRAAYWLERLQ